VNGEYVKVIRRHLYESTIPQKENKFQSKIQKLGEIFYLILRTPYYAKIGSSKRGLNVKK